MSRTIRSALAALVLVGAFLGTGNAEPAPPWFAFLWKVEGPTSFYILGTEHLRDRRAVVLPRVAGDAMADSDELMLELKDDQRGWLAGAYAVFKSRLRDGKTLDDLLPRDLAIDTKDVVQALGGDWERIRKLKPWMVTMMLTRTPAPPHTGTQAAAWKGPATSVEETLAAAARKASLPITEIETADEQFAVFDGMTLSDQLTLLRLQVDEFGHVLLALGKPRVATPTLLDDYFAGDEAAMALRVDRLINASSPAARTLGRRLLTDRNATMAARITKLRVDGKRRLLAIGVAHLVGPESVISRLRRDGLIVTRIE